MTASSTSPSDEEDEDATREMKVPPINVMVEREEEERQDVSPPSKDNFVSTIPDVVSALPDIAVGGFVKLRGEALIKKRNRLVKEHFTQSGSIVDKMQKGQLNADDAMNLIIIELMKETDSLKGNELLFTDEGNIRDATTVQVKRVEALEKIAKTVHRKHQMTTSEVINLDSPYIRLLVSWIMGKVRETFIALAVEQETVDVFFSKLALFTDDWKTQVKREMMMMKERQDIDVDVDTEVTPVDTEIEKEEE